MIGSFCLVLHSHLPWLPHHGTWPVGEEWLYQAWAASYLPVVGVLDRLADEGRRDLLTLGVTPVLAAQLDDPWCLEQMRTWVANWAVRADGARVDGVGVAAEEQAAAAAAGRLLDTRWSAGGSPVFRSLAGAGTVELLGGPAAHPFQPLVAERVRAFSLTTGLDDTERRVGHRPSGIWAPECAYDPGLEDFYAAHGVGHFLVDGPAVHGATADPVDVAGSGVVAFARDLTVAYRVWNPRSGYPGDPWYRDFHTFDHPSGLRPSRVTAKTSWEKKPYEPERAAQRVAAHAQDFVGVVRDRLLALVSERGRPGLVVAAYDTELFGHWWHEGPAFLEQVLRLLPSAGVRVTTLTKALGHHEPVVKDVARSSWGLGKDWHVWDGAEVQDLVATHAALAERLLDVVDKLGSPDRDPAIDQLARQTLLGLASDWPFMVSHRSAGDYARRRTEGHAAAAHRLADLLESGRSDAARVEAARQRRTDRPFGALDARALRL